MRTLIDTVKRRKHNSLFLPVEWVVHPFSTCGLFANLDVAFQVLEKVRWRNISYSLPCFSERLPHLVLCRTERQAQSCRSQALRIVTARHFVNRGSNSGVSSIRFPETPARLLAIEGELHVWCFVIKLRHLPIERVDEEANFAATSNINETRFHKDTNGNQLLPAASKEHKLRSDIFFDIFEDTDSNHNQSRQCFGHWLIHSPW